jgi:UPF0271 protein
MDLNCDMGEMPEAIANGTQEALMRYITSVNVACGGHAGDDETMRTTIEQALRWNLAIGAHPGYADRADFGRTERQLPPDEISHSVSEQVQRLARVASACGSALTHVKAHGALYNQAARDRSIAGAFAAGVARWRNDVVLVGLAGSPMLDVFRGAGFATAAEAFADRRYERDGSLRSRKHADALILDPTEAAAQAVRIAKHGSVIAANGAQITVQAQTICIHSDTPGAPKIAAAVALALRGAGITLRSISAGS